MKIIKYELTASDILTERMYRDIDADLRRNVLTLNKKAGEGTITYHTVQKGLFVTYMDLVLKEPIKMEREAAELNNFFLLEFFPSARGADHSQGNGAKEGRNYSVLLSSSMTSGSYTIPAAEPYKAFNIVFSKDWLGYHAIDDKADLANNYINNALMVKNPLLLYENIDFRLNNLMAKIQYPGTQSKIRLHSNLLSLLANYFEKLEQRPLLEKSYKVTENDLQGLLAVKTAIEENLSGFPKNDVLSEKAGMNISKFKHLFNQVFGKSPYQYHLAVRMEKAMQLLATHQYSVSEVAQIMGYSKLGQFSKMFKNYHAMLPSQVK